jgi:proline iminopeptidase
MKKYFLQTSLFLILTGSCFSQIKRETVLDRDSTITDSICYHIPKAVRFCDTIDIQKKRYPVGDCFLYAETEGRGIPMVVINGGPGGTHHYFHPWFSRAKGYSKIIYYDQRGCGLSDFKPGVGYSFEQAVDDLEGLRKAMHIDKWVVLGYSYGGAIAQYYAIKYPQNTLGMVLMSSVPMMDNNILNQSRQGNYITKSESKKFQEIGALYNAGKLNFSQLIYNNFLNGDWKRQYYYKPSKEKIAQIATYEWVNDKNFNGTMGQDYNMYNFEHAFDNCPIPTLLCEGKQDLTWLKEKAGLMKKNHPNAKFSFFENAGHDIYSEDPDVFFAELKKFITALSPVNTSMISNWKADTKKLLGDKIALINTNRSFIRLIKTKGAGEAEKYYADFKSKNPQQEIFMETSINSLGYEYLTAGKTDDAIRLLKLNTDAFPGSWNAYDSLAEAYLKKGNKVLAKKYYTKSVELNPGNESGKKALQDL